MAYPRFDGVIPGGKRIDLLIAQHNWARAIGLLKKAESDLTLRRKMRGNRILKLPANSKQRQIDRVQTVILNRKIDAICATLRGKNGLFWKTTVPKRPLARKQRRMR